MWPFNEVKWIEEIKDANVLPDVTILLHAPFVTDVIAIFIIKSPAIWIHSHLDDKKQRKHLLAFCHNLHMSKNNKWIEQKEVNEEWHCLKKEQAKLNKKEWF